MNLFCFTYALYILVLSMWPCGDACDHSFIPQPLVSEPQSSHNDHHEDEACSPFCLCPCCGTVCNQSHQPIESITISWTSALNQPHDQTSLLQDIYFSIWQPPKIS
ncbi:MAG: hypothetical protein IPP15_22775 [Saprospiraceae bacterium]|uniref:Secreted protein n=1 Tax=Candidatus Opimibacter skivensis TaxID=2982028 RepID=A0A9D7SZP0_9BACT|nr:hypothetical protein [Candidatus Opimibacter skivensis]